MVDVVFPPVIAKPLAKILIGLISWAEYTTTSSTYTLAWAVNITVAKANTLFFRWAHRSHLSGFTIYTRVRVLNQLDTEVYNSGDIAENTGAYTIVERTSPSLNRGGYRILFEFRIVSINTTAFLANPCVIEEEV